MSDIRIDQIIGNRNWFHFNKNISRRYGVEVARFVGFLADMQGYAREMNTITEDGFFFCTSNTIEEWLKFDVRKQRKLVKVLEDEGVLTTKRMGLPAKRYFKFNSIKLLELLNINVVDLKDTLNSAEVYTQECTNLYTLDYAEMYTNKNKDNKTKNNNMSSEENDTLEETKTDTVGRSNKVTSAPSSSKKDIQLVEEVISYLNEKTGKKFQASTKSYQKEILGRLKTGDYTLEDFKTVIDFKCKEWLNNEKMNKYLRPDTLFRDSNFNKYLNEAISSEKHIKETEDAIRIESFENKVDDERMEELFSLMGMGI